MGVPLTKQRGVCVTGKNGVRKYVPLILYKPFPEERIKAPGELISQFKAFPVATESTINDDLYWWTDCEFMPYNDSTIFTSSGAYQPRLHHPWIADKRVPVGRLCRFDFDQPALRCEVFSGTRTSAYPKVQFHPDSFHVGYLGSGEVKLVTLENTGFHSKARDLTFRTYKSFAISPDGEFYAVMTRNQMADYELLIFSSSVVTTIDSAVNLRKLNSEFKGLRSYNEHSECKWSADSNYIGVSLSTGSCLVLKRKNLSLVADVFSDVIPDSAISQASAFDFDPAFGHQFMAVGSLDRYVCVIDIDNGKIINQSDICGESSIDALKYATDGTFIGIAMQDFKIHLYDSDTFCVNFTIDMKESCPGLQNPLTGPYPAIIRLNFSMCGEQVVVGTHDGFIRIWQLPKVINLQSACKLKILSLVPIGKVKLLPLPGIILDYILNIPSVSKDDGINSEVNRLDKAKSSVDLEKSKASIQEQKSYVYNNFVSRETPTVFTFKNVKVNFDSSRFKTLKW